MSEQITSLNYEDLTPEQKVYMFEFIFPEALRLVFAAMDLTAYTNFVPPQLQKERPRAEIIFIPGAGKGVINPASQRESAWSGNFKVDLITAPDIALHAAYVSKVRSRLGNIVPEINAVPPMENHAIAYPLRDGGTSAAYASERGDFMTTLIYELDFSIQATAWALLAA